MKDAISSIETVAMTKIPDAPFDPRVPYKFPILSAVVLILTRDFLWKSHFSGQDFVLDFNLRY